MKIINEVVAESENVSCSGGGEEAGHPKVFLKIPKSDNHVICPYCSKNFILK